MLFLDIFTLTLRLYFTFIIVKAYRKTKDDVDLQSFKKGTFYLKIIYNKDISKFYDNSKDFGTKTI